MATIQTINAGDNITDSRSDINANFSALNSDKIETSVIDTDTALTANSDAKIPSQKAVKAYVDAGGDPDREAALSGGGDFGTPSASNKFVTEDKLDTVVKFGGDGSDGAFSESSGNTAIDLGGVAVFIKNYTSFSLTGTASISFTNPHANGTTIILRSQGDVTITSSASPAIDLRSLGGSADAVGWLGLGAVASGGTVSAYNSSNFRKGGEGGASLAQGNLGGITSFGATPQYLFRGRGVPYTINPATRMLLPGGGGVGGTGSSGSHGAGGRGAGALLIECAGALNFTGSINASGAAGGTSVSDAGGGGGAGGSILMLYKTLTANSGTVTVTGGTGGTGGSVNGGNGSVGQSLITKNIWFA